ncbi:MAG: hypothetical protein AB7O43_11225 [Hyphomicrobiaceae bacterium]
MDDDRVMALLHNAKLLAQEYRSLTGKPLGITGEVAEYEAARILRLRLTPARHAGYDATRESDGRKYQIKGRCILPGSKPGQRLGAIDIAKEFDAALLVLLDENFNAQAIYEAERATVIEALTRPGSRSRNERNAMGVALFKRIGWEVWSQKNEARDHTESSHNNGVIM